mmetsp:Transcript_9590/g.29888  ORF Transcript_9590/g.29888 Transcript_9590/m.29888 type:complete len:245 (+) Transcript_9590:522-1256(+)
MSTPARSRCTSQTAGCCCGTRWSRCAGSRPLRRGAPARSSIDRGVGPRRAAVAAGAPSRGSATRSPRTADPGTVRCSRTASSGVARPATRPCPAPARPPAGRAAQWRWCCAAAGTPTCMRARSPAGAPAASGAPTAAAAGRLADAAPESPGRRGRARAGGRPLPRRRARASGWRRGAGGASGRRGGAHSRWGWPSWASAPARSAPRPPLAPAAGRRGPRRRGPRSAGLSRWTEQSFGRGASPSY